MSDSPTRSTDQIGPDLDILRLALYDVIRRLRVATNSGDPVASRNAIYHEVVNMRVCALTLTSIVDDMCRICFPIPLHPVPKDILRFICEKSPIQEQAVRQRAKGTNPSRSDTNEIIDRLIDAGYVQRSGRGDRLMLIATEIGRAANAGIMWAQP